MLAARAHKRSTEDFLKQMAKRAKLDDPALPARQLVLLMDAAAVWRLIDPASDAVTSATDAARVRMQDFVSSCSAFLSTENYSHSAKPEPPRRRL
jgi:hypothetical protein